MKSKKNIKYNSITLSSIIIYLCIVGCETDNNHEIPKDVNKLDSVNIISMKPEAVPIIELVQEVKFKDENRVTIGLVEMSNTFDQNRIYKRITADKDGRVFIADIQQLKVHVFDSNGNWLQSIGRQGNGPGEFQQISEIDIVSDHIYVTDSSKRRIHVFDIGSFNLSHSINLVPQNQNQIEELTNLYPAHYLVRSDGTILMGFYNPPFLTENPQSPDSLLFYIMNDSGKIYPKRVLTQPGFIYYNGTKEFQNTMFSFEFHPRSLRVLSRDNYIFTNYSEEFLIKVYNPDGDYIRAIYYPFDKIRINKKDLINRENRGKPYQDIIQQIDLPQTYPVVKNMLMDNNNRLWVSTFTDEDDKQNWWVLNRQGDMLGRFSLPKHKWIREVKNNKVYIFESHIDTGEFDIVRYQVNNIK